MQRRPSLRRRVGIGAAIEEPGGELVVRVRGGEQERVETDLGSRWTARRGWLAARTLPSTGSASFMSAPASSSACTAAIRPSRAANNSAVNPPFERALDVGAARDERSTTSAWPSAAAHISAVCPRQPSFAFTSAPRASSSVHRLDLAGARGGHQHRFAFGRAVFGVGAGLQQHLDRRRVAVDAASQSGVTP